MQEIGLDAPEETMAHRSSKLMLVYTLNKV